jgi:integrase
MRYRGPHAAFRDTFATALLGANVPLTYVAAQLGHGDAAVTLRHYAKWLPRPDADTSLFLTNVGQIVSQRRQPEQIQS